MTRLWFKVPIMVLNKVGRCLVASPGGSAATASNVSLSAQARYCANLRIIRASVIGAPFAVIDHHSASGFPPNADHATLAPNEHPGGTRVSGNDDLLITDSITRLDEPLGRVIVAASHGGVYAAYRAAASGARAVILNDASVGRDQAGIGGLAYLGAARPPAASAAPA